MPTSVKEKYSFDAGSSGFHIAKFILEGDEPKYCELELGGPQFQQDYGKPTLITKEYTGIEENRMPSGAIVNRQRKYTYIHHRTGKVITGGSELESVNINAQSSFVYKGYYLDGRNPKQSGDYYILFRGLDANRNVVVEDYLWVGIGKSAPGDLGKPSAYYTPGEWIDNQPDPTPDPGYIDLVMIDSPSSYERGSGNTIRFRTNPVIQTHEQIVVTASTTSGFNLEFNANDDVNGIYIIPANELDLIGDGVVSLSFKLYERTNIGMPDETSTYKSQIGSFSFTMTAAGATTTPTPEPTTTGPIVTTTPEPTPTPEPVTFALETLPNAVQPGEVYSVAVTGMPDGTNVFYHVWDTSWGDLIAKGVTVVNSAVSLEIPQTSGDRIFQLQQDGTGNKDNRTIFVGVVTNPTTTPIPTPTPTPTPDPSIARLEDVIENIDNNLSIKDADLLAEWTAAKNEVVSISNAISIGGVDAATDLAYDAEVIATNIAELAALIKAQEEVLKRACQETINVISD